MKYVIHSLMRHMPAMLTAIIALGVVSSAQPADPATEKAALVKAGFIINFIKLTEWPAAAFASPDQPLCIALVNADPADQSLAQSIAGIRIHGRPLTLERLELPDRRQYRNDEDYHQAWVAAMRELARHQVAVFAPRALPQAQAALTSAASSVLLSIGDGADYRQTSAMLTLAEEHDRIVFYANTDSIQKSELVISPRLLRLAKTIQD